MKYIKEYKDFLLELRKVVSDTSGSGRTKTIDWVHNDPEDAKSTSAGILLRQQLKDKEFQDMVNIFKPGTPDYVIKDYIKKGGDDIKMNKFRVTMNNLQFLKDKAKEGELRCEYCNKGPLVIYDINLSNVDPEE